MTLRVVKIGTSLLRGEGGLSTVEVIERLTSALAQSLKREDFTEGVRSFIERRPPRFKRVGQD